MHVLDYPADRELINKAYAFCREYRSVGAIVLISNDKGVHCIQQLDVTPPSSLIMV
jgi:hypothetical protein